MPEDACAPPRAELEPIEGPGFIAWGPALTTLKLLLALLP